MKNHYPKGDDNYYPLKALYCWISKDLETVWLDAPKNGSTSIRQFLWKTSQYSLGKWCDNNTKPRVYENKTGIEEYKKNISDEITNIQPSYQVPANQFNNLQKKYYTFMVSRDPYARAVSSWKMMGASPGYFGWSTFAQEQYYLITGKRQKNDISFLEYCKNLEIYMTFEKHIQKQTDFMFYHPDNIYKLENLSTQQQALINRIKIPKNTTEQHTIQHKHQRSNKPYTEYYTPESRKIIENIYGDDIEQFGYKYNEH